MKITVEIDPRDYLRLRQIVAERCSTVDEMITVAVRALKTRHERSEILHRAQEEYAQKTGNAPQ